MGLASSKEGLYFSDMVNPPKQPEPAAKSKGEAGGAAGGSEPADKKKKKKAACQIDPRAKILKYVSVEKLWDKFLASPLNTFALSSSEAAALLVDSLDAAASPPLTAETAAEEVGKFMQLLAELGEKNHGAANAGGYKVVDFMALCSSVLLLGPTSLESKVDQLFQWIVLNSQDNFGLQQFLVALSSFERGLSNAMGRPHCSEGYVKGVAQQWLALADPKHKGDKDAVITDKDFFEFCCNRQHIVRRLLEALGRSEIKEDKNTDVTEHEVVSTVGGSDEMKATGGDEWMANPAWKKTAERMVPKTLVPNSSKPSTTLSLEWVHGYRGFDCRNNIAYLDAQGGNFFFHAAGLGVAQDIRKHTQAFFGEHSDDIISMSVYQAPGSSKALIATGDVGKTPAIQIYEWDGAQFRPLASVRGFHVKGVCQLAFAKDGKQLFSVGIDYTVALIATDVSSQANFGKMVASSQGPKDKVMGCVAVGDAGAFLSCGEKHAQLWVSDRGSLKQCKMELGANKGKMFMSAAWGPKGSTVCGTSDGDVMVLVGKDMGKESAKYLVTADPEGIKLGTAAASGDKKAAAAAPPAEGSRAHDKAVNALWSSPDGQLIVSGGAEGKVMLWKVVPDPKEGQLFKLRKLREFTGQEGAPLVRSAIRSVCVSSDGKKLLVGTIASEVCEFNLEGAAPGGLTELLVEDPAKAKQALPAASALVNGHFKDELWGLAVRPAIEGGVVGEYCTVGDDGFMRIWSIQERRQVAKVNLDGMARCCAYSPDGQYIAVGFGGSVGRGKQKEDGNVRVYRTAPMGSPADKLEPTKVIEFKEAKQWISCVRFSPDGGTLAVGARDNSVYLYSVAQQFKRKAKFSKHNAGILFLDFSNDGKFLQTCCSGYEILFSDTSTGVQVTNGATTLLDETWASWTCSLGWASIGIWSGTMDGSDVNAADRSPSSKLLATGDDSGKVKVFRYPCTKEGGAEFNIYSGHSSHVTNTCWASLSTGKGTPTDDYLLSLGGNDKCVFQWRNSGVESGRGGGPEPEHEKKAAGAHETSGFDALDEAPAGGDEFTAVKAWLGAIVAPTAWAAPDPSKVAPFFASLGEMASKHGNLNTRDPVKQAAAYLEVSAAAKTVMQKMGESGVVNDKAPDADELELEWVHGYRGFDCRNNVFYSQSGDARLAVYHAAALGVCLDIRSNRQRYFRGHTDDIMSMCVRRQSDGVLVVATGQQAMGNTYVWEANSMKTLAVLQTKQKSVMMLEFSKADGGRLLVSIAEDKSVAVSDWKSQTILANTTGEAAVTFHLCAGSNPAAFTFLSVGDKHLKMWALSGRNLTSTKVLLGKVTGPENKVTGAQAYHCCAEFKGHWFVGAEDSFVYVTADGKELKASFAAAGTKNKDKGFGITAMHLAEAQSLLVCGAKDGVVTGWGVDNPLKPEPRFSFSVDTLLKKPHEIMAKQVSSLFFDPAKNVLLVSTRGCDMMEVNVPVAIGAPATLFQDVALNKKGQARGLTTGVLQRSHCNDELWGVATHPTKPEYVTVGDDKTMRFYSLRDKVLLRAVPLGLISRTCCYGRGGALLALGFGGRVGKGKEAGGGIVRLYPGNPRQEAPLEKLCEAKDAKEWISDVKFSSDSSILCVGAHDCKIYIYKVECEMSGDVVRSAKLTLSKTFAKHNSVINHLDLSADGRFMQSNCSAYELLFCDTTTGKQITSATELKDVKWDTWTCTLGWPVQGIWAPGMDGADVNAVARSHSGHLVATSDDFGKVRLFRYPCVKENSSSLSYAGHSSHVTNIRWSVADECLISTGGNDKTIMQWRHTMSGSAAAKADDGDDYEESFAAPAAGASHDEEAAGMDDMVAAGGDESGCVKPWLGAVRTPKNPPPVNPAAPAVSLELKWVHGYTSAAAGAGNVRVSNNLFYGCDLCPVFPAAALGVRMLRDKSGHGKWTQRYFKGHNDDILCLAISPDRCFVATGQTASTSSKGKGSICVWDVREARQLCRMDACHQRGVVSLAFSPEGGELLSVGQDDKNTHILWKDAGGSWSRVQKTAESPSDQNAVLFSRWISKDLQKIFDGQQFVSGGAQAINFWKLEGATLLKKCGRFGKKKQVPLLCAANIQTKDANGALLGNLVVGTASGDLYIYDKDREVCGAIEKAHAGSVLCLAEGNRDCTFLVSGGKDRTVRVWNQALQPVSSYDLTLLSLVDASVASLDVCPKDGAAAATELVLLAGTYGGEIIEVKTKPGAAPEAGKEATPGETRNLDMAGAEAKVILYSHYNGELWGTATHPTDADIYATVGDDSTLRVWSVSQNSQLKSHNVGWPARSVAWHPCSEPGGVSLLAVGFMEAVKGGVAKKGAAPATAKGASAAKGGDKAGKAGDKAGKDGAPAAAESAGGPLVAGDPHNGAIYIYSVKMNAAGQYEIEERARGCDSAAWIGDIKWSPGEGRMLAAGSHDKRLYAYDFPAMPKTHEGSHGSSEWEQFWADVRKCLTKPRFAYNKHSSSVNHFDFSLDCRFVQTNCQAAELLFAETGLVEGSTAGKQITSATQMAEYNAYIEDPAQLGQSWASQTCVLGWPVQGIWPPGADTSDINSCDRSPNGKLLATADDFGQVKLFRYPAVQEGSKSVEGNGHSSHITNVRFTSAPASNVLISTGGNDKCVFVWSCTEK